MWRASSARSRKPAFLPICTRIPWLPGHYAGTIATARHLAAVQPNGTGPRFLLGSLVEASDDKGQAITIYRAIVADDPN